jgi:hypothetical protein
MRCPSMSTKIWTKRLELLHEMVPNAQRFAVLVFPGPNAEFLIKDAQAAAASMGRQIEVCTAGTSREIEDFLRDRRCLVIDTAFTSVVQKGADALLVGPYVFFYDSDLVVMPSGGRIFAFFCSARDHKPQNSGCVYTA